LTEYTVLFAELSRHRLYRLPTTTGITEQRMMTDALLHKTTPSQLFVAILSITVSIELIQNTSMLKDD